MIPPTPIPFFELLLFQIGTFGGVTVACWLFFDYCLPELNESLRKWKKQIKNWNNYRKAFKGLDILLQYVKLE